MTDRKFYKTTFTIEVMSSEPLGDGVDIEDLGYMIHEGECLGNVRQSDPIELDGHAVAKEIISKHGGKRHLGFFFLDENGNDIEAGDE